MPNLAVFSTSVEVFPERRNSQLRCGCLLHVRGGVSTHFDRRFSHFESSPRPWRCFSFFAMAMRKSKVFSTSVEVFLKSPPFDDCQRSLLHVRGGVSQSRFVCACGFWSSPRPWRCFPMWIAPPMRSAVFSTSVEVFPIARVVSLRSGCLLHVRGGVSKPADRPSCKPKSSPRPWRCFPVELAYMSLRKVFSTSVEVFLAQWLVILVSFRLLHVRGGVSKIA